MHLSVNANIWEIASQIQTDLFLVLLASYHHALTVTCSIGTFFAVTVICSVVFQ